MKLILITGRANSGKTTLANHLSKHFDIKRISASDYTKSLTQDHSRKSLESLFNRIIQDKWFEYLAEQTLEFAFKWEKFAIIDWLRHWEFLRAFNTILWKDNCFCMWISLSKNNRFLLAQNANRTESESYERFCEYEKNSSHEILADEIFWLCDYKIYDEIIQNKKKVYCEVLNKINNFLEK